MYWAKIVFDNRPDIYYIDTIHIHYVEVEVFNDKYWLFLVIIQSKCICGLVYCVSKSVLRILKN